MINKIQTQIYVIIILIKKQYNDSLVSNRFDNFNNLKYNHVP